MSEKLDRYIKKHFPYETFNKGQYEAIAFVVEQFEKGKKHVVLQAPTGIGKSAIATTVHRVLRELHKDWRTTIITSTKGLQDQYEQEDSEIYSLKGKTNYPCPIGADYYGGPKCRQARGEGICETPAQVCTYLKRRTYWSNVAHLRLTNTSFQVIASKGIATDPENKANLIVVDECHDIDEQLVNHSALEVDMEKLINISKATSKEFVNKFTNFINLFLDKDLGDPFAVSKDMKETCVKLLKDISDKIEHLEEKVKQEKNHVIHIGAIDELMNIQDRMNIFANNEGEWLPTIFEFSKKVELKPVNAFQVAEYALYRKADKFLHMSATICGIESYVKNLGIKHNEYAYLDIDNPIPVENRRVVVISKVKVSGDFDRVRLANLVDKIVKRHDSENGVVHTVSFNLAKDILENSSYKNRMTISNDRDEILDIMNNNKGKIILSPSVEKGYDFKGDMCRYQIIAKVPYYFLGDYWVKLNKDRDHKWYARKAILRLVQASGRAVRGVNDHATTYVIDSNFEMLLKRNSDLFPDWYLESLKFI